jgi:hypothetical protein
VIAEPLRIGRRIDRRPHASAARAEGQNANARIDGWALDALSQRASKARHLS